MTKASPEQASSTFYAFAGGWRQGIIIWPDTGCIIWVTFVLVPCVTPLDCQFHDISDFNHPSEPPVPSTEPGTEFAPYSYGTDRGGGGARNVRRN